MNLSSQFKCFKYSSKRFGLSFVELEIKAGEMLVDVSPLKAKEVSVWKVKDDSIFSLSLLYVSGKSSWKLK